MSKDTIKRYDSDTDIMRILAALGVVLIHASSYCTAGVLYNALARFSVPLFVMISGYYILEKNENIGKTLLRAVKLYAVMLVWGLVYLAYDLLTGMELTGLKEAVQRVLTQPVHLWYVYAICALYVLTPGLRVIHRKASKSEYRYCLAVTFLLGSVVTTALRWGGSPTLAAMVDRMKVPTTLGFVFMFLLGGYFRRFGTPKKLWIYALGLLGLAVTWLGTMALSENTLNDLLLSFFTPNVMASTVAVFAFVKGKGGKSSAVHALAGCTLGIYLAHPLMLYLLQRYLGDVFLAMTPWAAIPIQTFLAFASAGVLTYGWRKIAHR